MLYANFSSPDENTQERTEWGGGYGSNDIFSSEPSNTPPGADNVGGGVSIPESSSGGGTAGPGSSDGATSPDDSTNSSGGSNSGGLRYHSDQAREARVNAQRPWYAKHYYGIPLFILLIIALLIFKKIKK